jgi:hypothetical protein
LAAKSSVVMTVYVLVPVAVAVQIAGVIVL